MVVVGYNLHSKACCHLSHAQPDCPKSDNSDCFLIQLNLSYLPWKISSHHHIFVLVARLAVHIAQHINSMADIHKKRHRILRYSHVPIYGIGKCDPVSFGALRINFSEAVGCRCDILELFVPVKKIVRVELIFYPHTDKRISVPGYLLHLLVIKTFPHHKLINLRYFPDFFSP